MTPVANGNKLLNRVFFRGIIGNKFTLVDWFFKTKCSGYCVGNLLLLLLSITGVIDTGGQFTVHMATLHRNQCNSGVIDTGGATWVDNIFANLKKNRYGAKETLFLSVHDVKENLQVELFCGLECVGHSFADVAHVVFLRDVLILTQRAA
jgi:hypothetical protein